MITYKNIEFLKKRLLKNNGFKVSCWDDYGIKVNGRIYKLNVYGDLKGNPSSYVIFTNKRSNESIEIHYNLLKNRLRTMLLSPASMNFPNILSLLQ